MSYYEKRIAELEARVAQLAREQRLKAIPVEAKLLERYALMQADNTRLKAEAELLKAEPERLMFLLNNAYLANERLRKAGDVLSHEIRILSPIDDYSSGLIKAWNAAKEGKQS